MDIFLLLVVGFGCCDGVADDITSFINDGPVFPTVEYNSIIIGDGDYGKILHGSLTVLSEARCLDGTDLDSGP